VYTIGADPLHRWAIDRRKATTIDGYTVWLAPPEYVALRKLQYFRDGGSEKHLRDVRAMLRQLGPDIDRPFLETETATRLASSTRDGHGGRVARACARSKIGYIYRFAVG
jgi:hypothetical protein